MTMFRLVNCQTINCRIVSFESMPQINVSLLKHDKIEIISGVQIEFQNHFAPLKLLEAEKYLFWGGSISKFKNYFKSQCLESKDTN